MTLEIGQAFGQVWPSPDVMEKMGAKDALCKAAFAGSQGWGQSRWTGLPHMCFLPVPVHMRFCFCLHTCFAFDRAAALLWGVVTAGEQLPKTQPPSARTERWPR